MALRLTADLEAIVARLPAEHRQHALEGIDALRREGATSSRGRLRALAEDGQRDPAAREWAIWAMGRLGMGAGVPVLARRLTDSEERPDLRRAAALALGEAGSLRGAEPLLTALRTDPDAAVRETSAHALGMLGSKRATDTLVGTMLNTEEGPGVRAHAAEALAYLHDSRSVPALILAALRDPSPNVRFWSTFALGEVGNRSVLPVLEHIAATDGGAAPDSGAVRDEARDAMARITDRG